MHFGKYWSHLRSKLKVWCERTVTLKLVPACSLQLVSFSHFSDFVSLISFFLRSGKRQANPPSRSVYAVPLGSVSTVWCTAVAASTAWSTEQISVCSVVQKPMCDVGVSGAQNKTKTLTSLKMSLRSRSSPGKGGFSWRALLAPRHTQVCVCCTQELIATPQCAL